MICKARYRGCRPVLGAENGAVYTVEVTTVPEGFATPYLWVRGVDLPGYLIPYEGMLALLTEWEFLAGEQDVYAEHTALVDSWLALYTPDDADAAEAEEAAAE